MKKINAVLIKFGGLFAALALMVGVGSVGARCIIFFHQPKVPHGMSKFKKK